MLYVIPWFQPAPIRITEHFQVHWFGVFAFLAIVVGSLIAASRASREGVTRDEVWDLLLYVIVAGFVLGHFFSWVAYHPREFLTHLTEAPWKLASPKTRMSSFGGYLGGLLGALWWGMRHPGKLIAAGNCVMFSLPFAWTLARIGCFFAHDHPGVPSNFLLAVDQFHVGAPPYVARHDLGLYDALAWFGISVAASIAARRTLAPGFFIGAVPLVYCPIRFLLDFLRETQAHGGDIRYAHLTPGQYAAMLIFVLAALFHRRRARRPLR
jgi:phosphatidylglycerol:prolipoprotein diacylglycerol transferase